MKGFARAKMIRMTNDAHVQITEKTTSAAAGFI